VVLYSREEAAKSIDHVLVWLSNLLKLAYKTTILSSVLQNLVYFFLALLNLCLRFGRDSIPVFASCWGPRGRGGRSFGPSFCVCTDTGPAAREGFDLQLMDLPISQDAVRTTKPAAPPALDQDRDSILAEMGYSPTDVERLSSGGAFG